MTKLRPNNQATSDEQFPRFFDDAELRDAAALRGQIKVAQTLLAAEQPALSHGDIATLFKALNACALLMRQKSTYPSRRGHSLRMLRSLHQQIIERLFNANIGLVYSMYQRSPFQKWERDELLSAGFWSLFQAIRAFDPWRGYQFSTYACTAIQRAFLAVAKRETRRREVQSELPEEFDIPDLHSQQYEGDNALLVERLRMALKGDAAQLTQTERCVLERRFLSTKGSGGETLRTIGRALHLSKEGIRQIQLRALEKLKNALRGDPVVSAIIRGTQADLN